ncbi:MAG: carboxy terminal-processing peptidase [Ignavibacteriales bacterium]|nr:carboxy terminal-processing peptidase [Ignavibacteriales bacterium]
MLKIILLFAALFLQHNSGFLLAKSTNTAKYLVWTDTLTIIKPANHYQNENQLLTSILTRYHFKEFSINDSLSNIIFDRYLSSLDHGKNYFLAEDIESFNGFKSILDDNLIKGDVQFYYDLFNLYLKRLNERIIFIDKLLDVEFDYTIDESYEFDRDKSDWAKDETELNELWRKRLKNDALTHKLNGKDWEFIQKTLRKRYKNYADFLNKYNSEDVFQLAMNSFTQAIDPHTNYLSPVSSDNFKIDMSLSLEGIGARLQTEDDYTKVAEIIPGGPADKSGLLKADDKIIAVAQGNDGEFEDIIGWRITDAVKLIRGTKGTTVRLQIIKAGSDLNSKPMEISLVREKVKLEDQAAKGSILEIINEDKPFKIGVIDIPKFYNDFEGNRNGDSNSKSTTKDVKKIIDSLKIENIDGLVIDLRDDGGGSLQEAIELTGLFIKDGPVVQVKNSDGNVDIATDPDPGIFYDGPLTVLVNRFSASASEIFAGAIQDYERGFVLGEQTYGKGTVQNLIDLNRLSSKKNNDLGQIKITIAKFYRINGGSTQNLGVVPDISYPTIIDPEDFGESSEPSALPWDEISSTDFHKFSNIKKYIATLSEKHQKRIAESKDFNNLIKDIEEYKINKNKTSISLNEEIRKIEKEKEKLKELNSDNIANDETQIVEDEIPIKNEKSKDYILDETAKILTDFILLTIG